MKRGVMRWLLVVVFLAASGCVNLKTVSRFAKISAATADSDAVIADYTGSLERLRRLEPEGTRQQLDEQLKIRREQQKRLLVVQRVLADYLNVLGELAADDLPSVDKELDALKTSLGTAQLTGAGGQQLSTTTTEAAVSLTALLARVATDFSRQADIKKLLLAADKPFAAVIAGLREVFDTDLRSQLENENVALENRFKTWEHASKDPVGAAPIARLLLEERQLELQQRVARIDAYLAALKTIGEGHELLVKNASKLDVEDLQKKVQGLTDDVKKSFTSVKKLVTE